MKDNSTLSGEAGENGGERALTVESNAPTRRCHVAGISSAPEPGSREWRQATGLKVLSDYALDYESIREPRGPYSVSLPEDLIE